MWKSLFIATYVWAGFFTGSVFHQSYMDNCSDKAYMRTTLSIVLWPIASFIYMGAELPNKCKETR